MLIKRSTAVALASGLLALASVSASGPVSPSTCVSVSASAQEGAAFVLEGLSNSLVAFLEEIEAQARAVHNLYTTSARLSRQTYESIVNTALRSSKCLSNPSLALAEAIAAEDLTQLQAMVVSTQIRDAVESMLKSIEALRGPLMDFLGRKSGWSY